MYWQAIGPSEIFFQAQPREPQVDEGVGAGAGVGVGVTVGAARSGSSKMDPSARIRIKTDFDFVALSSPLTVDLRPELELSVLRFAIEMK